MSHNATNKLVKERLFNKHVDVIVFEREQYMEKKRNRARLKHIDVFIE